MTARLGRVQNNVMGKFRARTKTHEGPLFPRPRHTTERIRALRVCRELPPGAFPNSPVPVVPGTVNVATDTGSTARKWHYRIFLL